MAAEMRIPGRAAEGSSEAGEEECWVWVDLGSRYCPLPQLAEGLLDIRGENSCSAGIGLRAPQSPVTRGNDLLPVARSGVDCCSICAHLCTCKRRSVRDEVAILHAALLWGYGSCAAQIALKRVRASTQ